MTHPLETGGGRGYRRVATEEAFATREQVDAFLRLIREGRADKGLTSLWGYYGQSPSERATKILERLLELGDSRIADMDATGIDIAVLALTAPGGQPFEAEEAKGIVRRANDQLAAAVERYPGRYVGLTSIVPQDPAWSVEEIRRGARELGFKGVMVNSHTQGHYLDEPVFDSVFRALAEIGQPLYIHPQTPPDSMIDPLLEAGLDGAIFGFGVETGMHLLRLMTSGLFDRYPDQQVIAGHGCEALPFWLYRLDYMHQGAVRSGRYERMKPLKRGLPELMRQNILATTSGLPSPPSIKLCIEVMGEDRVMYAMDYPYQFVADEVRTHDTLDLPPATLRKLMQTNAERVFGFKAG